MSEEGTLITDEPVVEESDQGTVEEKQPGGMSAENSWFLADEVTGEGDRPEWFKEKYKSVADQAKAYSELEKRFGGFTGSPEDDYEMSMPEGVEGEFNTEDPRIEWFKNAAKEANMSQETFTNILHGWVGQEAESVGANKEEEIKALGSNAQTRLRDLGDWGQANLSEDQFESFKGLASTAKGVEVLEALIQKSGEGRMPAPRETTAPSVTETELQEMIAAPEYQTSRMYREKVSQMYEDFYG